MYIIVGTIQGFRKHSLFENLEQDYFNNIENILSTNNWKKSELQYRIPVSYLVHMKRMLKYETQI